MTGRSVIFAILVTASLTAGATYVIEIWSLNAPGETFELKTSFQPA